MFFWLQNKRKNRENNNILFEIRKCTCKVGKNGPILGTLVIFSSMNLWMDLLNRITGYVDRPSANISHRHR